jgi:hypothetical protein
VGYFLACALKPDTVQMLTHRHAVLVLAGVDSAQQEIVVMVDTRSRAVMVVVHHIALHQYAHQYAQDQHVRKVVAHHVRHVAERMLILHHAVHKYIHHTDQLL